MYLLVMCINSEECYLILLVVTILYNICVFKRLFLQNILFFIISFFIIWFTTLTVHYNFLRFAHTMDLRALRICNIATSVSDYAKIKRTQRERILLTCEWNATSKKKIVKREMEKDPWASLLPKEDKSNRQDTTMTRSTLIQW